MSVCLSTYFRPHALTWLPLNGFPWNLTLGTLAKSRGITLNIAKSKQKCRELYIKTQVGFIVVGDMHSPKHALLPNYQFLRRGADKSLARPTSPWRRTESIVSLERGIWSCAELQVFSYYRGWKEACQAKRAISTTSRRELSSSSFFLSYKARRQREFTPFWEKH